MKRLIAGVIVALGLALMPALTAGAAARPALPTTIPVLDWHELNNGCLPSAAVCNATDPESVSTAQLTAELGWLRSEGYNSISASQYLTWAEGKNVSLPSNPIFLVADNGIEPFLVGAAPVLRQYDYTMAVAVVTGFADGASNDCPEPAYEAACPLFNVGWDATWAQLRALPSLYSFIFEAGIAGHFVQTYDPTCTDFYACVVPGETTAQYERRVTNDITQGISELHRQLGQRAVDGLWVVPYGDLGYTACTVLSCVPQPSDGPAGWLVSLASSSFGVVFVEDSFCNGIANERYRVDVQGWMTLSEFESLVSEGG